MLLSFAKKERSGETLNIVNHSFHQKGVQKSWPLRSEACRFSEKTKKNCAQT